MPTKEHESEKEHIGIDISSAASAISSKHATQNIAPGGHAGAGRRGWKGRGGGGGEGGQQ
jgi:hypothetical protein